jgi:hypothetical protein
MTKRFLSIALVLTFSIPLFASPLMILDNKSQVIEEPQTEPEPDLNTPIEFSTIYNSGGKYYTLYFGDVLLPIGQLLITSDGKLFTIVAYKDNF